MPVLSRCRFFWLAFLLATSFGGPLSAQSKSPGSSPSVPSRPTPSLPAGSNPGGPSTVDTSRRVFFISGRVAFDDGAPLNSDIAIQRVCGTNTRVEAHTDSKGRFNFQLGNNPGVIQDASVPNDDSGARGALTPVSATPTSSLTNSTLEQSGAALTERSLNMCDLRAVYPGYRSDKFSLANRKALDNPDVGTLILHRLGAAPGSTISLSSAMAPKPAQKAYERAIQQADKGNVEAAEASFTRAVDIYPQYASAWYEMGRIRQSRNRPTEAKEAFLRATKADPKFASPYDRLAQISSQEGNWTDAITYSSEAIALDPIALPSSWFYNALGHWSVRQFEDAGKSAQETLKLDSSHTFPMAELILAASFAGRSDYTSEMQHLRAYLAIVPDGKNSARVRERITDLEQQFATAKK
jgi:Tfp pilus assembly protein PilF